MATTSAGGLLRRLHPLIPRSYLCFTAPLANVMGLGEVWWDLVATEQPFEMAGEGECCAIAEVGTNHLNADGNTTRGDADWHHSRR